MRMSDGVVLILAKVFVRNPQGQVLVLRRSKTDPRRPLTWDLPGGNVEYGEDPANAAIREAHEEAGLTLDSLDLVDVSGLMGEKAYIIWIIYSARVHDTKIVLSYEHDQCKWVSVEELLELDMPKVFKSAAQVLVSA